MLPGRTIITTDASLEEIKKIVRKKAIEEFAEALRNRCKTEINVFGIGCIHEWEIDEIVKELKGE